MRVLAETEIPFSEEDAEEDVFGVASDWSAIYRWQGDHWDLLS